MYEILGWPVSPYTTKTSAWLRYKQLDVTETVPTLLQMRRRVMPAVGRFVMPVVQQSDGSFLQDSAVILETLERRHPEPATDPSTPRQAFVSALFEFFGDDWLVLPALHYRWNVPASKAFAIDAFAAHGLPWVPRPLGRKLSARVAAQMASYLPKFGVVGPVGKALEGRTETLLTHLETHLQCESFLLGAQPCVGDFAMFGMIRAHLQRDGGAPELFSTRPALRRWCATLQLAPRPAQFAADDHIPETLTPLMQVVFAEQWPWVHGLLEVIDTWVEANPEKTRLPRSLGTAPAVVAGIDTERTWITFQAWKAQRVLDRVAGLDADWLAEIGGQVLTELPPLRRQRVKGYGLELER